MPSLSAARPAATARALVLALPLLLTALAVGSCGRKSGPAASATGPAGRWESVERQQGGMGYTLEFQDAGVAKYTVGVMMDGTYRVRADTLLVSVGDSASGFETRRTAFRVAGDTLLVTPPQGGAPLAMRRTEPALAGGPVTGSWTYAHPVGADAYETFTPEGQFFFRLFVQRASGTWGVTADSISVSFPGNPPFAAQWALDGDRLSLTDRQGKTTLYHRAHRVLPAIPEPPPPPPMEAPPAGQAPPAEPPAQS